MYFFYGYCLNVYLIWFPTYLNEHRHFDLKQMGLLCQPAAAGRSSGRSRGRLGFRLPGPPDRQPKWCRRVVAIFGFLLAAAAIVPATLTSDPMPASGTRVSPFSASKSRSACPGPSRSISAAISPARWPPS